MNRTPFAQSRLLVLALVALLALVRLPPRRYARHYAIADADAGTVSDAVADARAG